MPDRRSFLSGLAALPLVGGGAMPALAGTSDLGALWHRRQLARGALTRASALYDAARTRLPWWAKSGPMHVDRYGAFSGRDSHWPALETYSLPEYDGAVVLIRIGPLEIERQHETRLWFTNEARARELRARDQAALDARLAKQRAAEAALGLPALGDASDSACDALCGIDGAIEDLEDGPANVTAARVLVRLQCEAGVDETLAGSSFVGLAAVALRGLLPHLAGDLAIDAADVLADPDRPVREMRISRGILPSGEMAS